MKVIFIQDLAKIGKIGEIKEVASGYALNVLIPKKYAVLALPSEIKKIEQSKKNKENKTTLEKDLFLKAILTLEHKLKESKNLLEITGHKHSKGHLFAKISAQDIVNVIYEKIKISLNPSQIILPETYIKEHGEYEIEIKNKDTKNKIKILVK